MQFHKKILLKKSSTVRTANRFEVLYNLDKDGTQEELCGKRLPLIVITDISSHL
jgi:hypothetical protein